MSPPTASNDPPPPVPSSTTATSPQWSPQTILSTLRHPPKPHPSSPLPFLHLLQRLKTTPREGWRRFGLNSGESIADHMYRMAILTLLIPPSLRTSLDTNKCTRLAIVHDMAEALVGDITPVDGVSKAEKRRREGETMTLLCEDLLGKYEGGQAGMEIKELWWEYEDDLTEEAHFVHDVDKIELLLQMVEYERDAEGRLDLGEFAWVAGRVTGGICRGWASEILKEREEFWKGEGRDVGEGGKVVGGGVDGTNGSAPPEALKKGLEEYYRKNEGRNGSADATAGQVNGAAPKS
ncbi:hypothetical protein LTR95_014445 [Oleoguttula sp. CCFEE 5521]